MGKSKYKNLYDRVVNENKKKRYPRNPSKISDVSNNFNAETLYIGSRKRNSKVLLRIYDKKKEQLS
ncbi:hypothetical protein HMPREF0072_0825 [Anaerococcus lactolyticus ATCC 51172]|uniref:Uncharacterized protein n=1 Tax=Anaerococcus lactolyticus ATCC 51172 TaxID=525254 RepID=C2BEQ5_9FIRM|nr:MULTISPECIES: replication initiation factor domain-containing protein [Anaerococcus]EEI86567.1 hypothetical protein HMPREF0072_0825 [Anaerococcus lactolyticus ATCC 51172]